MTMPPASPAPRAPSQSPSTAPAVVLLSGGLDSAVTLAIARARGHTCTAVTFDYGQRHRNELLAAARVAASLGATSLRTIKLDLRAIGGSALTADIAVPKDRDEAAQSGETGESAIPITYVPARNLIFLSLAAGLAETVGARHLFIGVNALDYSGYPDCREPFIRAFETAVNLGTQAGVEGRTLAIESPLVHLTKAQIITEGTRLGVDFSLTHSCYDPIAAAGTSAADAPTLACGHCDSCILRRRGFEQSGVPDPTRYAPVLSR